MNALLLGLALVLPAAPPADAPLDVSFVSPPHVYRQGDGGHMELQFTGDRDDLTLVVQVWHHEIRRVVVSPTHAAGDKVGLAWLDRLPLGRVQLQLLVIRDGEFLGLRKHNLVILRPDTDTGDVTRLQRWADAKGGVDLTEPVPDPDDLAEPGPDQPDDLAPSLPVEPITILDAPRVYRQGDSGGVELRIRPDVADRDVAVQIWHHDERKVFINEDGAPDGLIDLDWLDNVPVGRVQLQILLASEDTVHHAAYHEMWVVSADTDDELLATVGDRPPAFDDSWTTDTDDFNPEDHPNYVGYGVFPDRRRAVSKQLSGSNEVIENFDIKGLRGGGLEGVVIKNGRVSNVLIEDLYQPDGTGRTGGGPVGIHATGKEVVIEHCTLRRLGEANVDTDGDNKIRPFPDDHMVRSQGIWAWKSVKKLTIRRTLFDAVGWRPDIREGTRDWFDHNVYSYAQETEIAYCVSLRDDDSSFKLMHNKFAYVHHMLLDRACNGFGINGEGRRTKAVIHDVTFIDIGERPPFPKPFLFIEADAKVTRAIVLGGHPKTSKHQALPGHMTDANVEFDDCWAVNWPGSKDAPAGWHFVDVSPAQLAQLKAYARANPFDQPGLIEHIRDAARGQLSLSLDLTPDQPSPVDTEQPEAPTDAWGERGEDESLEGFITADDGLGVRARPGDDLQALIAEASKRGEPLRLAAGVYPFDRLDLPAYATLIGVGPATVLEGRLVRHGDGAVLVSNLQIRDTDATALDFRRDQAPAPLKVHLSNLYVRNVRDIGVLSAGAELVLVDSILEDVGSGVAFSSGLVAADGKVVIRRNLFLQPGWAGNAAWRSLLNHGVFLVDVDHAAVEDNVIVDASSSAVRVRYADDMNNGVAMVRRNVVVGGRDGIRLGNTFTEHGPRGLLLEQNVIAYVGLDADSAPRPIFVRDAASGRVRWNVVAGTSSADVDPGQSAVEAYGTLGVDWGENLATGWPAQRSAGTPSGAVLTGNGHIPPRNWFVVSHPIDILDWAAGQFNSEADGDDDDDEDDDDDGDDDDDD